VVRDYVGFYWTLPVPWAGHIDLPEDAAAAAALSLTIRYQRERVQRYVAEVKGRLVSEIPFIDMQHDRATEAVRSTLRKHAAACAGSATLLYVRFSEVDHWRRNVHLLGEAASLGFEVLPLPPDPVVIDGVPFDPIRHFTDWRERDRLMKTRLEAEATAGLRVALEAVPDAPGRWRAIAERLNSDGIRTVRGALWTAEGVRKAAGRNAS
jgi:hypothetical protein